LTFSKKKEKKLGFKKNKRTFYVVLGYQKMIYYTPELLRKNPTITGWKGNIIFMCIILIKIRLRVQKRRKRKLD